MFAESINIEDIDKLEYASCPGEIQVIEEDGAEFDEAIAYLSQQELMGFDTETRPCFSPNQPRSDVSLLQLSSGKRAFLFRLNTLKFRRRLRNILANPQIIKVGAAVRDDIRGLQHLAWFQPAGFVDLQQIVWQWGVRDKSVKKMAAIIMGVRISKTQQLSNWEAIVLNESQIKYAATDAWVCEEMYKKLMVSEKNPLPPDPVPVKEGAASPVSTNANANANANADANAATNTGMNTNTSAAGKTAAERAKAKAKAKARRKKRKKKNLKKDDQNNTQER